MRYPQPNDRYDCSILCQNFEEIDKRLCDMEECDDPKDGFSPIAKVEQTEDGAKITITDVNGTTEAIVKNGKDGIDGKTPQKGTDYFTEADKQAFVTDVINALPTWQGGAY